MVGKSNGLNETPALHVFRVYLIPREFTWITGVVLAVLTASFGVTKKENWLLGSQNSGVLEAIPGIGSTLVELLRGSASVGQSTLTRLFF